MTGRLLSRPLGYKVGLLMIIIAIIFTTIGSSLPSWHTYKKVFDDGYANDREPRSISYISGLWGKCLSDYSDCEMFDSLPGYVSGTRTVIGIGTFLLGVAIFLAIWLNICKPKANRPERDNVSIEVVAIIGSIFGIIGSIIYGVGAKEESSLNHIGAAFAVNCVGYIIGLTASLLIAVSHGKRKPISKSVAWPYTIPNTGLVDRHEQIADFPVDNPAFVDPTQIRFTRTTRPSNTSGSNPSVASSYSHRSDPTPSYNQYQPRDLRLDQGYKGSEMANRSTDHVSEADLNPPSYDSIMLEGSSFEDMRGEQMVNAYQQPQYQRSNRPHHRMGGSNEVEI